MWVEQLESHLARIDDLVDAIAVCGSFLDDVFLVREVPVAPVVRAELIKPDQKSESEIANTVAIRIKRARDERGWRQQDLSEVTGIARPNIARLESGRRMPKISTLQKIAEAFGFRMEELLG